MATQADIDHELVSAYRDLLDRHARITCAMERELQQRHGLGMSEFEVLDLLAAGACGGSRRMQELASAVHLSQSALSRVVGRLEAAGLVERAMCTEDRRGIFARLTDEGRARHEAAVPTRREVLERVLGGEDGGAGCAA